MTEQAITASVANRPLRKSQVYIMAATSLAMGLAIGLLSRGSQVSSLRTDSGAAQTSPGSEVSAGHTTTLAEMKQSADQQVAPLLEKLKSNGRDIVLLAQVGAAYHTAHQFAEAARYYERAVNIDPANVAIRTNLASSLYRSGDVDGAIAQLNLALRCDPQDANALFDLGMIRLQGKGDGEGAVRAWQQLLKSNPQLSDDRKTTVQKLMAEVLTSLSQSPGQRRDSSPPAPSRDHHARAPQVGSSPLESRDQGPKG